MRQIPTVIREVIIVEMLKILKPLRMIGVATWVLIAVLVLAVAPAAAVQPVVQRVNLDITGIFLVQCTGFTVTFGLHGFIVIHVFFNSDGSPRVEIDSFNAVQQSFTNSVTGKTLSSITTGINIIDFEAGTFANAALAARLITPEGTVVLDAGYILVDLTTFQVLEAHGPKGLSSTAIFDQLCSIMA